MLSAKKAVFFIIPLLGLSFAPANIVKGAELSQCALCHTDPELIDELTEEAIMYGEGDPEISSRQIGNGYGVKQAPFDLYEKILVSESFLSSTHGQIPCQLCHLGNPDSNDPATAHAGMLRDPSLSSTETCGQCHEDIVSKAINSLHMNATPLYASLEKRCSREQMDSMKESTLQKQCLSCHQGSCGSCHVSRPAVSGGGLRQGHIFKKKPDFVDQCLPCHTSPTGNDFIGKNGKGDVHYRKHQMTCSGCHSGPELHASAGKATNRYHFDQRPQCIDCHTDISTGPIPEHVTHKNVSCYVCHAAPYQNCTSCHIGLDENGVSYSQSSPPKQNFKIGLNPDKKGARYVLMREVGIHRDTFKNDIGKMKRFSALPTYKMATPHTIQRRTWQTADCNHCHGNKDLFLTQDTVPFDAIVANNHVLLKSTDIPEKVQTKRSFILSPTHPDPAMRVSADWLKKHYKDKNLVILDTRTKAQYEKGHIPGAYHLCFCLFRTGAEATPPYMMLSPQELAKTLGGPRLGLSPDTRVVLYDDGHSGRGIVFLALQMIGHQKISFLDGNISSWEQSGFTLAKGKAPQAKVNDYPVKATNPLVDNHGIIELMGSGQAIVVDVRNAAQHNGHMKRSDITKKGGSIPESLSFPLQTVVDGEGMIHSDERLSWLLSTAGINQSREKKIIVTCNTNMLAAEFYMILTYLGYDNVRIHDGSWAEWSAEFQ
ncbi:rhodanese-related sulfurtransferase [Desulfocapsa sulfexigens DSM 10523]|uniref:Rhodanese-related sulfurtransferase n=1 Tax=Desulfocapsa sulfexigens (strain DSM 10523 / SB164P1) TaxID=1167006 RepID=M1N9V0_DESSD|nr:rhodanese-like domain-containing protein [Desulfocapsa sulfexigens]AGF76634.1 rhodanese-related sulfurtransferase [Desulfocapsa sulfexigens DSM 10523]